MEYKLTSSQAELLSALRIRLLQIHLQSSLPGWTFPTPPVQIDNKQSLFKICSRLPRLIGFVWSEKSPDQHPRSLLMLTKAVICTASLRAEWGHTLAADHTGKQTNAAGGCAWRGAWSCGVPADSFEKVLLLLVPKRHKVSRSEGKRSALSPSGRQEKGWMNLKQTSERLAVSQTAQQRNHLPRAWWTDWVWQTDVRW